MKLLNAWILLHNSSSMFALTETLTLNYQMLIFLSVAWPLLTTVETADAARYDSNSSGANMFRKRIKRFY